MAFLLVVFVAIFLFIRDFKIMALVLFFFFVTSGFDLIPEEVTKFAFISKGIDYALIILISIVAFECLYGFKSFLKADYLTKYILYLAVFVIVCMAYSKVILGYELTGIIRTCRYLFFWMTWFVFRSIDRQRLEQLMNILFYITAFCSVLYILQLFLGESILNEGFVSKTKLFGMVFPRYYNQPAMLHFFVFVAIFRSPAKGILKLIIATIMIIALLSAFHRSLIGSFFLALALGFILQLPRLQRIKVLTISAVILGTLACIEGYRLVKLRTFTDIQHVMAGNLADIENEIDIEDLQKSTFTFRMAHLVERNMYLLEHKRAMFIGAGLVPEDSKDIEKLFNFDVGLADDTTGKTYQVDTGDISYSMFLIRFGYIGTALIILPLIMLTIFFYRHKGLKLGLLSFSYMVLTFGVSFFSANLTFPHTFLLPMLSFHILNKSIDETTIPDNSININL
jgi:hypothetical protein